MSRFGLVVIGTSWGGLKAMSTLLDGLPQGFRVPMVLAQHRHPDSDDGRLVSLLRDHTHLEVCEAENGQPIEDGHIYVSPASYHTLVEPSRSLSLSVDAPLNFNRPSIDQLFESAADAFAHRLVAVVLTGANDDGANGVRHVKRRGGVTVAQLPSEAARTEMPQAAVDAGADRVLPLARIAPFLAAVCMDAQTQRPPANLPSTGGEVRR